MNEETINVSAKHLLLGYQDIENTDLIRQVLKLRQQENLGVALEMAVLSEAILMDDDYAWTWHCNLVGACITADIERDKAEKMAIQFMWLLFAKKGDDIPYAPMAYTQNPIYKRDIDSALNAPTSNRRAFKIELSDDIPEGARPAMILKGISAMLAFGDRLAEIKQSIKPELGEVERKDVGYIAQEISAVLPPTSHGSYRYISVVEGNTATDLAMKLGVNIRHVIRTLMGMGINVTSNNALDVDATVKVIEAFGHKPVNAEGNPLSTSFPSMAEQTTEVSWRPTIYIEEAANIPTDVKNILRRYGIVSCVSVDHSHLSIGFNGRFSDEEIDILRTSPIFEPRGAVRVRGGAVTDYSDQFILKEIETVTRAHDEKNATLNSVIVFTIYT